jgi:small subunit ribosomal protein S6
MRDYELMYIVPPTVTDEEFPAASERVDGIVTNLGGEIAEKQPWGKRRLAYPIDKHEDGYYVLARVRLEPARIGALEELLRISEDVLRHMLVEPVAIHIPRQPRERQNPADAEAPRRYNQA